MTWEEKRKLKKEKLTEKVPRESFINYYMEHSLEETAEHFEISNGELLTLNHIYNFKKPKSACSIQIKKSKLEKYGDENYNNRDKSK